MTGQNDTALPMKASQSKKSKLRFVWWALLWLVLGALVCAALVWHKRYSLAEWQVRKAFAKAGITAQLDIDSINKQEAVIENISLSSGGEEFFAAKSTVLYYDYKQLRNGELKRILVREPSLKITLDSQGNITNEWMPKRSEKPLIFPSGGVVIEDARLRWSAPFGGGSMLVNTDIASAQDWTLMVDSQKTELRYDDVSVQFGFQGSVEQHVDNAFSAVGSLNTNGLDTQALKTGAAKSDFNLVFSRDKDAQFYGVGGWLELSGVDIDADAYGAQRADVRLDLQTRFDMQKRRFDRFAADWDGNGVDVALKEAHVQMPKGADAAPLIGAFVSFFPVKLNALLQKFTAKGQGHISISPDGYRLDIGQGISLKNDNQNLVLRPSKEAVLLYDAQDQTLTMQGDVDWSGARALHVSNFKMRGQSQDGKTVSRLIQLQARLRSDEEWTTQVKGQTQRLSPMDLQFDYDRDDAEKIVSIQGNLDYDGFVPGGQVTKLKAGGAVRMVLGKSKTLLGFSPSSSIHMDSFISGSGWRGEAIKLTVQSTDKLLEKTPDGTRLQAVFNAVSARVTSPENDRHMAMDFETLDVTSMMGVAGQVWDVAIKGARIASDDMPSPGTKIASDMSTLHVEFGDNGALQFVSKNPSAVIETQNVRVGNIAIDLSGSPDDFSAQYTAKSVEMIDADYPVLPMRGTARFQEGVLTGNALTDLPKTKDTPIKIDFRSVDGRGEAHIAIPKIVFDPSGLQPQHLVPSLAGKLADVRGVVSAQFDFAFGGGQAIHSKGTTDVVDMDIGTLVGPLSGVNTQLVFSSIFPLKTKGTQVAKLSGFDPGFPLEDGTIRFEIVPDGVRIDEAIWPVENVNAKAGKIYIAPMLWKFGNVQNRAVVHVENVELGTMLTKIGKGKLAATGKVTGVLPAVIDGISTRINNGLLTIKDGGVIRFKSEGTDAAAERSENASYAFQALENFTYKKMEMRIDGPIDGDMSLDMLFDGKNPEVLGGQTFLFDVGVQGELVNIAQNLKKSFGTKENLEHILRLLDEDPSP